MMFCPWLMIRSEPFFMGLRVGGDRRQTYVIMVTDEGSG